MFIVWVLKTEGSKTLVPAFLSVGKMWALSPLHFPHLENEYFIALPFLLSERLLFAWFGRANLALLLTCNFFWKVAHNGFKWTPILRSEVNHSAMDATLLSLLVRCGLDSTTSLRLSMTRWAASKEKAIQGVSLSFSLLTLKSVASWSEEEFGEAMPKTKLNLCSSFREERHGKKIKRKKENEKKMIKLNFISFKKLSWKWPVFPVLLTSLTPSVFT